MTGCVYLRPSDSRKLGTAGQKLGGAAVLCHIRHDPVDPGGSFTLTSANVGKCQTVLCRNGQPLPLSRSYVMSCEEELKRIKRHKAIITEVRGEPFSSGWWGGWGQGHGRNQPGSISLQRTFFEVGLKLKLQIHVSQSKFFVWYVWRHYDVQNNKPLIDGLSVSGAVPGASGRYHIWSSQPFCQGLVWGLRALPLKLHSWSS